MDPITIGMLGAAIWLLSRNGGRPPGSAGLLRR